MIHIVFAFFYILSSTIVLLPQDSQEVILYRHTNASTKSSWSKLTSIHEVGTEIYADSNKVFWDKHREGTQRMSLKFQDSKGSQWMGENESDVWRIVDSETIRVPKMYLSPDSRLNLSYAISRRTKNAIYLEYLKDTIIGISKFHFFKFKEGSSDEQLLYINTTNYLIERIEYKGVESIVTTFDDYKWVGDFLIAHTEIGYLNGKFDYIKKTQFAEANQVFPRDIFYK
jgi:hypothetical protein